MHLDTTPMCFPHCLLEGRSYIWQNRIPKCGVRIMDRFQFVSRFKRAAESSREGCPGNRVVDGPAAKTHCLVPLSIQRRRFTYVPVPSFTALRDIRHGGVRCEGQCEGKGQEHERA